MQNVDRVCKLGNVNYAECSIFLSNPNLSHAMTDAIHRLPVIRVKPFLYLVKLVARLSTSRCWKVAKVVQRPTPKLDWLDAFVHNLIIQNNAYTATN